jgi:hypothetical protein
MRKYLIHCVWLTLLCATIVCSLRMKNPTTTTRKTTTTTKKPSTTTLTTKTTTKTTTKKPSTTLTTKTTTKTTTKKPSTTTLTTKCQSTSDCSQKQCCKTTQGTVLISDNQWWNDIHGYNNEPGYCTTELAKSGDFCDTFQCTCTKGDYSNL